jgi:hypothetical protein
MMRTFVPAFLILSAGCSASGYMRDSEATAPPGPDEAKVVIYRSAVLGGVDNFPVFAVRDGVATLLGFTETDGYFEVRCAPGRMLFLTWCEGAAFVEADLAGGNTYYLRTWSKFGLLASRPGFAPVLPGSDRMRELEKDWSNLRPRELDPALAPEAVLRFQRDLEQVLAGYGDGAASAKAMGPEHGRSANEITSR